MSLHSDDLALLGAIAAAGSLAAAARTLDVAPPAVTKRLAALEARLGVRLVERNTRRLRLTTAGELAVERGRPLLAELSALDTALRERAGVIGGRLRVSSSYGFGRAWLAPLLVRFREQHPQLAVELHLGDRMPALEGADADAFDAAVWLWAPRKTSLVVRRLAANRRIVVAAPAYLKRAGVPQVPADLTRHACLVVNEHDAPHALWRLEPARRGRPAQSVRVGGMLSSNSGEVVRDWALAGQGLMLRSWWDVQPLVAAGRLVHVLPEWAMRDADVHFVTPPRDPLAPTPQRVRLLREFLAAELGRAPWAR